LKKQGRASRNESSACFCGYKYYCIGLALYGNEAHLLELADSGIIRILISSKVLKEARYVLEDKFNMPVDIVDGLLDGLVYELAGVPGTEAVEIADKLVRDPKDAIILASILTSKPDIALTGDKDLLTDEVRAVAPVCRCSDYLKKLKTEN